MDLATRRLSENRVSLESQTAPGTFVPQIPENYSYDPAGNVTAIRKDDGGEAWSPTSASDRGPNDRYRLLSSAP